MGAEKKTTTKRTLKMILLFSNRGFSRNKNSHKAYNNRLDNTLRLSNVTLNDGKWDLTHFNNDNHVESLKTIRDVETNDKPWVFFVHGYNLTLEGNLEQIQGIIDRHNVNVIGFSWPSRPIIKKGFPLPMKKLVKRYRAAQRAAEHSAPFLYEAIEAVNSAFILDDNPVPMSFMVHSLGNYLFECMIKNQDNQAAMEGFQNLIFSQADVNAADHQDWITPIPCSGRRYVLTNWQDMVLSVSNTINATRLGQTIDHKPCDKITYVDYTDAIGVGGGDTHGMFKINESQNEHIHQFIYDAVRGDTELPNDGFERIEARNTHQIIKRYGNEFGAKKRLKGGRARHKARLSRGYRSTIR